MPYELIQLDTFIESLGAFREKDRKKLLEKINEMLSFNPKRYGMLKGHYTLKGVKFVGLHKMKSGASGRKGGAYILYRICEECKENEYYKKSDIFCKFCDDEKSNHVVLFIARHRGLGY